MTGLKANPGGNIPPDQAVGREGLCKLCWRTLESQSLRLENERRLGKTTVLRILATTAPMATRTIFMEVGGISTVTGFIEALIKEIDDAVPEKKGQFSNRIVKLWDTLAGAEIAGVIRLPQTAKAHWRAILQKCFQEIQEVTADRIVFFWDEVPWMVAKIKKEDGEPAAIDLLDTLRDIRQTYDNIRMVFTGSIGFHHVISAMEEAGVPARPVNDMRRINVPSLAREDGMLLAKRLFIGERFAVEDMEGTAAALHELTGGIPYYIHHVVADLIPGGTATPEIVARKIRAALTDPNDPWDMRHFRTRLKTYYGKWEKAAGAVLDTLAASDTPLPLSALHDAVRASNQAPAEVDQDSHATLNLLRNLMRDHYLTQEDGAERRYLILFPLIRRWWRIERGME